MVGDEDNEMIQPRSYWTFSALFRVLIFTLNKMSNHGCFWAFYVLSGSFWLLSEAELWGQKVIFATPFFFVPLPIEEVTWQLKMWREFCRTMQRYELDWGGAGWGYFRSEWCWYDVLDGRYSQHEGELIILNKLANWLHRQVSNEDNSSWVSNFWKENLQTERGKARKNS